MRRSFSLRTFVGVSGGIAPGPATPSMSNRRLNIFEICARSNVLGRCRIIEGFENQEGHGHICRHKPSTGKILRSIPEIS